MEFAIFEIVVYGKWSRVELVLLVGLSVGRSDGWFVGRLFVFILFSG